ncbi:hypothetical protein QAD02_013891 [Eretmocerus hayati]|uniref:Uncharacterized protein n=1 Tax=Eretmocerus hayati TaxID=131215 RepID=A0ACC2P463_9HYME|nr:hypothetical protein QAD02_013891 [Eretmocerus hayati]
MVRAEGHQVPQLSDFYGQLNPRCDVLHSVAEHERLSSGKNIFFHETSCLGNSGYAGLSCRQACAVESAALINTNMTVNLLFLDPSPQSYQASHLTTELVTHYHNVRVYRLLVREYMKDTPLQRWYTKEILGSSSWPTNHMSDILRYLTLWKFGGIYMDLDVIVIR